MRAHFLILVSSSILTFSHLLICCIQTFTLAQLVVDGANRNLILTANNPLKIEPNITNNFFARKSMGIRFIIHLFHTTLLYLILYFYSFALIFPFALQN